MCHIRMMEELLIQSTVDNPINDRLTESFRNISKFNHFLIILITCLHQEFKRSLVQASTYPTLFRRFDASVF